MGEIAGKEPVSVELLEKRKVSCWGKRAEQEQDSGVGEAS